MKNKINEEILRIKEVMGLVSESFGIPDNIFKTSENVYEKIKEEIKPYFNSSFFRKNGKLHDSIFVINFNLPIKFNEPQIIGKASFNEIDLNITVNVLTDPSEPRIASWADTGKRNVVPVDVYRNKKKVVQKDGQIKQISKIQKIKKYPRIDIVIVSGSNNNTSQIFNELFSSKNKVDNVSAITHELKHWYDSYLPDFENAKELLRYISTSETIDVPVDLKSLDKLFFLLYYCSNIENSVRVVEIKSRHPELNKQNFWEIIKKTDLYKKMILCREFKRQNFDIFLRNEILELMTNHPNIPPKKFMELITKQVSSKINNFLNTLGGSYRDIGRNIPKSERKILLGDRSFEKVLKFFEKILNESSEKMVRIIGKIYSSLPD